LDQIEILERREKGGKALDDNEILELLRIGSESPAFYLLLSV